MTRGAIILAGGRSSRMGRDKATLPDPADPDRTWLERTIEVMREALGPAAPVIVCAARGQALPELRAQVLRDDEAFAGPLTALHEGLRHARDARWDTAYVAPIDQLRLTAAHVEDSARRLATYDGWAVVPEIDGVLRPLAASVRVSVAATRAWSAVTAGGRAARDLFDATGVLRYRPEDVEALRSFDTPDAVEPG